MSGNGHSEKKDPVLVIVQLSGGNDFMNTLVPYNEGHYYDARPLVGVPQDEVMPINDELGFNPAAERMKKMYDNGDVAVIQGIGYPNSSRSHFRGMDIMHTCEPDRISTEGWVAKLIQRLDPDSENPLTGINIGRGLPRAMAMAGVTATSVGDLDNYGLMPDIQAEEDRNRDLEIFKRMYTPAIGAGMVMDYLRQTGIDSLAGADMLAPVPGCTSRRLSTARTRLPRRCAMWPGSTRPAWALASSTPTTSATTRTRTSRRFTRVCCAT